jgi:hypothetical protein
MSLRGPPGSRIPWRAGPIVTGGLVPKVVSSWRDSVRVREATELEDELEARWRVASGERAVGVTDLLAPRVAFWRWTHPPLELDPARQSRIDTGRRLHRILEAILGNDVRLEVRVRRDGIVGRIDALSDRPIEVKSGARTSEADDLREDHPEHLEQLAMYCALVGSPRGRLITVAPEAPVAEIVRTSDVEFRDLAPVREWMAASQHAVRQAVTNGSPRDLPRCRWFARGCEFREQGVCDCTGAEPEMISSLATSLGPIASRADLDAEISPRLSAALAAEQPGESFRFRELVYPRRSFFERTSTAAAPAPTERPRTMGRSAYERLVETIEGGLVGEVACLAPRTAGSEEDVSAFRGTPYLARTSRAGRFPAAEELVDRYPQYSLELGFRCAVTGTDTGTLFVAHERGEGTDSRLRVFTYRFAPVTPLARMWRNRSAALVRALGTGDPFELPGCPGWMFPDCPYRSECGCGSPEGRSQR